ncbi:hypothetical protein K438DRAFT_2120121 [Mycena galopus ATCC 62051]|nr:hypothetical protein K438DRAFT_2120121 [Mycena galopus ATCC 62051]
MEVKINVMNTGGVLEPDNFQGYEFLLTRQTKALPCRSKPDTEGSSTPIDKWQMNPYVYSSLHYVDIVLQSFYICLRAFTLERSERWWGRKQGKQSYSIVAVESECDGYDMTGDNAGDAPPARLQRLSRHTIHPVLTALVAGAIAVQGLQTCDSAEYDLSQYTCFNVSLLCPIVNGVKYQACGEDCYSMAEYTYTFYSLNHFHTEGLQLLQRRLPLSLQEWWDSYPGLW